MHSGQNTSAYVGIRQHTSAYAREYETHTSSSSCLIALGSELTDALRTLFDRLWVRTLLDRWWVRTLLDRWWVRTGVLPSECAHTSAYVSNTSATRQHTPILQKTESLTFICMRTRILFCGLERAHRGEGVAVGVIQVCTKERQKLI